MMISNWMRAGACWAALLVAAGASAEPDAQSKTAWLARWRAHTVSDRASAGRRGKNVLGQLQAWRGKANIESLRPPYHPEHYDTLEHDGLNRTYMVHVPPCYVSGTPIPIVLVFHGGGGTPEAVEQQSSMNRKADAVCFLAVYPSAVSMIGKPGRLQYWNAGELAGQQFKNQHIDDVGFVAALLQVLQQRYTIDAARVYATGISQGAWMSYRVACDLSNQIAAIAPISGGLVTGHCEPAQPVAVMHFHGTAPPGWPYAGGGRLLHG